MIRAQVELTNQIVIVAIESADPSALPEGEA